MRKSTIYNPVFEIASVVFLLACLTCAGQTTSTEPKAADVLTNAKRIYSQDGPAKALLEYEKALALFQKEGDHKGEAITIGLMGNTYKRLGQHAKALEFLLRALKMKRELGDRLEEGKTLNNLGLFYWETADYQKAIESLNNALAIAKELSASTLESSALNNLGLVFDELGNYRESLSVYNRALEIYQRGEPSEPMANTIGNIGGRHLLLGEYSDALRYYQQALAIDEKLGVRPSIALDLENIGLSLVGLGRNDEAIKTLDRGITLSHDAGLVKEEADCRKAKASAFLQLGRYTEALDQYNLAIKVYQKLALNAEPEFQQNLVEGLSDLGNLELRLGDVASAEGHFHQAIDVSEKIKHPRGVTTNLLSLGDLQFRQSRFSEAAALYEQALARATAADDNGTAATARVQLAHTLRSQRKFDEAELQARQALETARTTQARPLEADAVYALAEVARERQSWQVALSYLNDGSVIASEISNPELSWRFDLGRGQVLQGLSRDEEALTAFQNAVKTIETVRGELREERFRAGYIEDKYQAYVALVQLLLKLGRPEEAFVAAEKLRARSYLDLLSRGQPPIRNQSQREKETTLRSRIRDLQKKLETENSKTGPERHRSAVDLYSKELNATESEYAAFLDDISSSEPSYAAALRLKVPSGEEIRARLPQGTALVEYVIGESDVVIFVLTAQGLRAMSVPAPREELKARVETLRDLLLRNRTSEWKLPAATLYRTLVEPIATAGWLKDTKQLYIVPHAILHYVPFAVLQNKNRLLIDDYVIALLPAAAALVNSDKTTNDRHNFLAMAPSNTRLQYNQIESQAVSNFFPKGRTLLIGSKATESSFKRLAGNFDLVHLATHGYFNKLNPLLSGLELESDASDDGRLEVHEIMGLRLKAKLVTLSACDTAVGSGYFSDIPAGDDLVGLSRAFLSAGASSVMASLWEVNDRSAMTLMDRFYSRLLRTDNATALALAQRDLKAGRMYRHPYYWASFEVVGQIR